MKTFDSIEILKDFIKNDSLNIYYDNDNNIIIDGDVVIFNFENYNQFPVKIHKVNGSVQWYGGINKIGEPGTLTSLVNFPDIVTGDVQIFKNQNLTTLDGCPKYIGGTFQCDYCNISDISGIAEYIGKDCIMNYNPISDINALHHVKIGGIISIIGTPVSDDMEQINNVLDSSIVRIQEHVTINFNE